MKEGYPLAPDCAVIGKSVVVLLNARDCVVTKAHLLLPDECKPVLSHERKYIYEINSPKWNSISSFNFPF